jgi:electron-transferring-flavoprotein dehydrogenase
VDTEVMSYDFIIVGAGPAGLSAAIKLKQHAQKNNVTLSVLIIEKGAAVGSHILSGAVLDPRSLKELLPDSWADAPLDTKVSDDKFMLLTEKKYYHLPTPAPMKNNGNYIISLGDLCKFLAQQAELLGCEIYPGFVASDILYNDDGDVIGVQTGAVGIDKTGFKTENYHPGMQLLAKQTLFAEGCRGELSQRLMERFNLRAQAMPQTYGLGIKEVWKIAKVKHQQGLVVHTVGWPLDKSTYGGSFIYHMSEQRVAVGLVVGLDYKNTWLNPFDEMQRFKTHPLVSSLLENGERTGYGARVLNEGGWQSIPKLTFPGGVLIGDAAGFLNVAKIKGIHTAMQSGMLAADACFEVFSKATDAPKELSSYEKNIRSSWINHELYKYRNVRPGFRYGLWFGLINAGFETYISRGKSPWTLAHHEDYLSLENKYNATPIHYPKPDGKLTFDRLSSVYLSNTFHAENQPAHLRLKDPSLAISVNYELYASPETRYCPAAVYEILVQDDKPHLQINAQNCIHCKTCDIKDPKANIVWTAPEGGGGPNYSGM